MGGDGKRLAKAGGMGIAIREISVDTRRQGKVTLIWEKGFPTASPALVRKDYLGLREVKD